MKIAFLTQRLPFAPDRGDRIRAYYLLQAMSRFADVTLFSLVHDADEASHAQDTTLPARVRVGSVNRARNFISGALTLPTSRPLTHALLDSPMLRAEIAGAAAADPPDLVVAFGSGMARFALEPPLKGIPLVLDMVDVDSEKWAALANTSPMWRRWIYRREASTLSVFEAAAATTARVTFVVNEREADALRRIAPHAAIEVVPNGVDVDAFRPSGPPAEAPMVVFCGVMNYQPNEDGVLWFVREVWPKVRAAEPRATFTIVGSGPGPSIRALAADDSITVTGRVDRVQPYLWRAAVAVAPLRIARGIQNKVLEAIGAGVPVVVTPAVMAGVPDAARDACVEAADSDAFSQGIVNLFHTAPHDRRRRAERAHLESLRWPNQLRQLEALLQRAWTVPGSSR